MPSGIQQEKSVTIISGRSGLTDMAPKTNVNIGFNGQSQMINVTDIDLTGRDAIAPGGFAPAPGEYAAKVDLEGQSELGVTKDIKDMDRERNMTFAAARNATA